MIKKRDDFESSRTQSTERKRAGKLSLYPLTLETALNAALLTGKPSPDERKKKRKKAVNKQAGD